MIMILFYICFIIWLIFSLVVIYNLGKLVIKEVIEDLFNLFK